MLGVILRARYAWVCQFAICNVFFATLCIEFLHSSKGSPRPLEL